MNNFWRYFIINEGINSGIAALSYLVASKIGDQPLQDKAQQTLTDLHDLLELWNQEKASSAK